jgi:alanine racemase
MRQAQVIELDSAALRHNLRVFRDLLGTGPRLAGVVKANAYGHGMDQIAPVAAAEADWLAVHSAEEAGRLRDLGLRCPILVMGFVPESAVANLDQDTHVVVSAPEVLSSLGRWRAMGGVSCPVHLKVDTGTNRQGVTVDQLPGMCRQAAEHGLDVVGLATHFANIEDTLEHDFARAQLREFTRAAEVLSRCLGGEPTYVHAACSAAVLLLAETHFDLVRVGISMYGHWPSRETRLSRLLEHGRNGLDLEPVLTWKACVGQVQEVGAGETVGYGRTWTALRPTRLAVLPVGYSDGYPRCLGNRARVLVHGVLAPVVGRVCMNIMMVDVTDVADVAVGDEVVLLGEQGGHRVTAEELAGHSGTINYELLARLAPSIPRQVV